MNRGFSKHIINCCTNFFIVICLLTCIYGCTPSPQKTRRLGVQKQIDTTLLAQMDFNQRMANAADKECFNWVKQDTATYTLDEFGFWYKKDIITNTTPLQQGQEVNLHITIRELSGQLVADIQDHFVLGGDNMPIAFNRALKMMSNGEKMTLITPWYSAYGIEGTKLIKPYSNLIITLQIEK